jgi:alkaline phosphatase D
MISGDQFFGNYHRWESYEGLHPKEFKEFKESLRRSLGHNYIFISGDRHLVEVMKIDESEFGKEAYEFTISGMHTKMYPGSLARDSNKRRVSGFDGTPNYGVFDISSNGIIFSGHSIKKKEIEQKVNFK